MLSVVLSTLLVFNLLIKDSETGKGIPEAQVVCIVHGEGGVTGERGQVRLELPPGKHKLQVTHIGYEKQIIEIDLPSEKSPKVVYLTPRVLSMPSVEVVGTPIREYDAKTMSYTTIQRKIPVGEPDVLRALQILPEISSVSDFASAPAIRGLSANYTHIYLGDAPILNPYHVGGLFSAFDYGMIGKVKVYSGVAPAEYGDYGGGMVRLQSRFTSEKESQIELGLISTKFRTLYSPTKNWQSSLSLRYFTLDVLSKIAANERAGYYFYDAHWANRWSPTEELLLETNCYFSSENLPNSVHDNEDAILYERVRTRPNYKNIVSAIQVRWRSSYLSLYNSKTPMEMETNRNWVHNQMVKYGLKFCHSVFLYAGWLKLGLALEKSRFDYNWHFYRSRLEDIIGPPQYVFFDDAPPDYDAHFSYHTMAIYAEYNRSIRSHTDISIGIRLERFRNRTYSMPRLTLGHQIGRWRVTMGYGLVYQYTYALKEKCNMEIFTPFTIRFPASDRPIDIRTVSFHITPPGNHFSTVLYLRQFHHTPIYDWNTYSHVRSHGFSAGMEFSYEGRFWKGDWTANYTLATSRVAWRNRWLATAQDRRHQLKISLDFPTGKRWRWGWQFQLASGYPYSTVTHWLPTYTESIIFNGAPLDYIPRFGEPNNARYPAYHRLDMSLERDFFLWGGVLMGRLTILNLYNRKNPFYYAYTYEYYSYLNEKPKPQVERVQNFPLLPTIHFVFKF